MTRRRGRLVRNLMISLLVVVLVLLIPAIAVPSSSMRRVLFAVVIYSAILLLLTAILLGWAKLERVVEDKNRLRVELHEFRREVRRHIAVCEARQADADLDDRWRQIITHVDRSA